MLYEMWMIRHDAATEQAFARLSEAEMQEFQRNLTEAHNAAGATVLVNCNSGWANEEYGLWGLTIFPDMLARLTLQHKFEEAGMFRLFQSVTMLGTSSQEPKLPTYEHPVYLLSRLRNDADATVARRSLSQEQMQQLWTDYQASYEKNGGCRVLECNPYWANDAYWGFSVHAFPGLEELQNFKADLMYLDWPLYYPSESILGLPTMMASSQTGR